MYIKMFLSVFIVYRDVVDQNDIYYTKIIENMKKNKN